MSYYRLLYDLHFNLFKYGMVSHYNGRPNQNFCRNTTETSIIFTIKRDISQHCHKKDFNMAYTVGKITLIMVFGKN